MMLYAWLLLGLSPLNALDEGARDVMRAWLCADPAARGVERTCAALVEGGDVEAALRRDLSAREGLDPDLSALLAAQGPREILVYIARRQLGLPPLLWSEAYHVSGDLSAPVLDLDRLDFKAAGDLRLAYQGARWSIGGEGKLSAYDLSGEGRVTDTLRSEGRLHAAWSSARRRARGWRYGLRGELWGAYYDSSTIDVDDERLFADETSAETRAQLLGAARYQGAAQALGVWLGGGYQRESFDGLVVTRGALTTQRQASQGSAHAVGRLWYQRALWGEALAARAALDGLYHEHHHIARPLTAARPESRAQLEISGRLSLAFTWLATLGLEPYLDAGFEAVYWGESSALVPLLGAGLGWSGFY